MTLRKIIEIDEALCDGCGQCVPGCAEGALQIVDGKARLVADMYCDGLGACLGECPTGALRIVERDADPFDEAAVEELLAHQKATQAPPAPAPQPRATGGCPSARVMQLTPCQAANRPHQQAAGAKAPGSGAQSSELTHWPVQLRLVPPQAPFLKNADVLLLADCAALAVPDLHAHYLAGRVALMACPKFDDAQLYVQRLTDILRESGIRSLTVLEMEVPCCSGLTQIALRAATLAQSRVPVLRIIAARTGQELQRERISSPLAAQSL